MTGILACRSQRTPTSPSGASLASIVVNSSSFLARVGQTAQLTAREQFSDGSTMDVTAIAMWASTNPAVVTISATGLATVVGSGTATVTASIAGVSKTGALSINVPGASVIVTGRVMEPGGFFLPNAEVTLIGGAMDGRTTTADQYGGYTFGYAEGAVQVRASKSGYITSAVNIASSGHTDITLNPTVPYADVGGNYRVTFTASPSCQLPDDVRTRAYSAAILQDGARLTIRFSGPQFSSSTNWMEGRIYDSSVNLNIGTADDSCFYYHQCFVEFLGDGRSLALSGTGSGTAMGSAIDVLLAGAVTIVGPIAQQPVTCTAPDHHLTFSR